MFIIRPAVNGDLPILMKFARMVHFINLPPDKDIIAAKIARSARAFDGECADPRERMFLFCLEDTDTGNVVGTSSVMCCVSWEGHPHTYLQVRKRELFSTDLQSGQVQITLQLGCDETGPSEMGGLILAPGYRGHRERLGGVLSRVRFHFMGLHRDLFADRVIAEMMGTITPDSRNLLWEYLGRRFINLSYKEADLFCQHSKEFITSLFPREEIYASLLPPEARNLIGKVGEETRPAKAMLEAQGFRYHGQIDPFDGGPYIEANCDEIPLVAETRRATLDDGDVSTDDPGRLDGCLVSCEADMGFRATRTACVLDGDRIRLSQEARAALGAPVGSTIGVTPPGAARRSTSNDSETAKA